MILSNVLKEIIRQDRSIKKLILIVLRGNKTANKKQKPKKN